MGMCQSEEAAMVRCPEEFGVQCLAQRNLDTAQEVRARNKATKQLMLTSSTVLYTWCFTHNFRCVLNGNEAQYPAVLEDVFDFGQQSQPEVSLDFMIDGRPRLPTPDHTNRDGIEIMLSHRLGELKVHTTLQLPPFFSLLHVMTIYPSRAELL